MPRACPTLFLDRCVARGGYSCKGRCGAWCSTPGMFLCAASAVLAGVGAEGNSALAWDIYEPERGEERASDFLTAAAFALTPVSAA